MNAYLLALCWAFAMMAVALLSFLDVLTDDVAQTLLITLPLIAVISLSGMGRCARRKAA